MCQTLSGFQGHSNEHSGPQLKESTFYWKKTISGKKGYVFSFNFHMFSLKRCKDLTK